MSEPIKPSIRLFDLKELIAQNRQEYDEALARVLNSGSFINGTETKHFELRFSDFLGGNGHTVGCGNGTDALFLAAKALELPTGSEALIPAMTYTATAEALIHAGLKVRLVDISYETYLMDLDLLEKTFTPQTRLVVPVHLYGQMVDMKALSDICKRHSCYVIEDASQAHGAMWENIKPGELSHAATFSFYPGKNLGAFGDAGAVFTQDEKLARKIRMFGNHGSILKYEHEYIGFNSRLDDLQSAILNVRLGKLLDENRKRIEIAERYYKELNHIQEIRLPQCASNAYHVYHQFVIVVPDREALKAFLASKGIETGVHYPKALNELSAYSNYFSGDYLSAMRLARHALSLPIHPLLQMDDILKIANAIRTFFDSQRGPSNHVV